MAKDQDPRVKIIQDPLAQLARAMALIGHVSTPGVMQTRARPSRTQFQRAPPFLFQAGRSSRLLERQLEQDGRLQRNRSGLRSSSAMHTSTRSRACIQ